MDYMLDADKGGLSVDLTWEIDTRKSSLLHLAAISQAPEDKKLEVICLLVGKYGADVNAKDIDGRTPINYIATCRRPRES